MRHLGRQFQGNEFTNDKLLVHYMTVSVLFEKKVKNTIYVLRTEICSRLQEKTLQPNS